MTKTQIFKLLFDGDVVDFLVTIKSSREPQLDELVVDVTYSSNLTYLDSTLESGTYNDTTKQWTVSNLASGSEIEGLFRFNIADTNLLPDTITFEFSSPMDIDLFGEDDRLEIVFNGLGCKDIDGKCTDEELGSGVDVGTVLPYAGGTIPNDWLLCDGSQLLVADEPDLFAAIGNVYGGDGITNFNLPDLRGVTIVGTGQGVGLTDRTLADTGGEESVTLTEAQLPSHSHTFQLGGTGASPFSANGLIGSSNGSNTIFDTTATVSGNNLDAAAIATTGSGDSHENMQPFIALNYIIRKSRSGAATVQRLSLNGNQLNISGANSVDLGTVVPNTVEVNTNIGLGGVISHAGSTAPTGWLLCQGQLLNISDYPDLFNVISNTFGGDGVADFQLPDLRGRTVIGSGQGVGLTDRTLGSEVGEESVILTEAQLPSHTHTATLDAGTGKAGNPNGGFISDTNEFDAASGGGEIAGLTVDNTGLGESHNNVQPSTVLNYIIKALPEANKPFIGEIKMLSSINVPDGWALCDGSLVSTLQYPALGALLGTTWGPGGVNQVNLPDMRSRVPMGVGQGSGLSSYSLGQSGGQESVVLTEAQIPQHTHTMNTGLEGMSSGATVDPEDGYLGISADQNYREFKSDTSGLMADDIINNTGSNEAHPNIQPYLTLNYIIYLGG